MTNLQAVVTTNMTWVVTYRCQLGVQGTQRAFARTVTGRIVTMHVSW